MITDITVPCSRSDFAELTGMTRQRVDQLAAADLLATGATAREWLQAYIARLRDIAAGRDPDGMLVSERALLARAQREAQELKNAVTRGQYASIELLGDVLGLASSAVADRIDSLAPALKIAWPDMPTAAREAIDKTVANARNEWVRGTRTLIDARLDVIAAERAAADTAANVGDQPGSEDSPE